MPTSGVTERPVEGMGQLGSAPAVRPRFDESSDPATLLSQRDELVEKDSLAHAAEPVEDSAAVAAACLAAFKKYPNVLDGPLAAREFGWTAPSTRGEGVAHWVHSL
jgi:hypothetical protein